MARDLNALHASLMTFPMKSRKSLSKLKIKKPKEQRWPGRPARGLNTLHGVKVFGVREERLTSAPHSTDRTILRLDLGRQFSQFPKSAFLSKPCLIFSLSQMTDSLGT